MPAATLLLACCWPNFFPVYKRLLTSVALQGVFVGDLLLYRYGQSWSNGLSN